MSRSDRARQVTPSHSHIAVKNRLDVKVTFLKHHRSDK